MDFKVGDKVMLKSGGPVMNIKSITGGTALCVWYNGSTLDSSNFNLLVLVKA